MKRLGIRALALFASAVLTFTVLAGCGGTEKQSTATGSTENTAKAEASQSSTAQEETVTIKWFINDANPSFTAADNALKEAVEKANNVKLEFDIPPASNYKERLQITLASGTYPDLITMISNTDDTYLNALNNGILLPLNTYIDDSKNIQNYTYDFSWDSLKKDGTDETYGIPRTTIIRSDGYFIRQDWLDNLGIKINPLEGVTLAEFEDILKKFTLNDPDKNGKQDTFGYGFISNADGSFEPFIKAPFGILGWQKSTAGEFEYMNKMYDKQDSSYKNALEFSARMYKEGYIDPSTPLMKSVDQLQQKFNQGSIGITSGFAGHISNSESLVKQINPTAKLTYLAGIKDTQGKMTGVGYGSGYFGFYSIAKTAKNPERIVKMLDWMLGDEGNELIKWGVEGVTYTEKDGVKVATEAALNNNFTHSGWMRRKADAGFFVGLTTPPETREQTTSNIQAAIDMVQISLDRGYKPAIASDTKYIDAQKNYYATTAKIILGGATITDFDKMLDSWYKAGGEQYIKEMNDYISKIEK